MNEQTLDFVYEGLIIDATRLIKAAAKKYKVHPRWVHTRFESGVAGRTVKDRVDATKARHEVIFTLVKELGYPKDLVARAFSIAGDTTTTILRKESDKRKGK